VNCRAVARASLGVPRPPRAPGQGGGPAAAPRRRAVRFPSGVVPTAIHDRSALRPGDVIEGPAIVDQMDATTVIFPGDVARVDGFGNLLIAVGAPCNG